MEKIPNLIYSYYCDSNVYKSVKNNKLRTLCLKEIVSLFFKNRYQFTIEEILDAFNAGEIVFSYLLVDNYYKTLNIRHLEELFDDMVILFNKILEPYIKKRIYDLYSIGELVTCKSCYRTLLLPNDQYYYAICQHCDWKSICNQGYYTKLDGICKNCNHNIIYYRLPIDFKAKLNCDNQLIIYRDRSIYRLINNQLLRSNYNGQYYYCSTECISQVHDEYKLKILNKYYSIINDHISTPPLQSNKENS